MPEDYYTRSPAPARSGGGMFRVVLAAAFLAFIAGATVVGWLAWDGKLALPERSTAQTAAGGPGFAQPSPAPSASTAAVTGQLLETQVSALEQRLARIDLQSAASEGNTARAEALLVALAARRAIERGATLGYLEDQLKLRFGAANPAAVSTIIAAAKDPVTLDRLAAELDRLAPQLTGTGPDEGSWSRFRRQVSDLFVVHRDQPGLDAPAARLDHARLLLRSGQVDSAIEEVSRLPTSKAAGDWLAMARRYAQAESALDQIEQTALAEPEKLKAGTGEQVRQPGPAVSPSAPATPAR
ncbi:MAG: hypothetical protein ACKOPE_00440 [Novosphingobium sp.]